MTDDPFLPAAHQILEVYPPARAFEREIRMGVLRDHVMAEMTRQRIAQEEAQFERRAVEGIGSCIMRVPVSDYVFWIKKEGRDCWADKGFRKSVLKKNPEVRVRTRKSKLMVGYGE